jgi:hypothetical protein
MRIVDTFLFCEEYERELLLLKLNLEDSVVSDFVLIESDVTFRGDFKGFHARKLIENDDRFAPFRAKLRIIEQKGRLFDGPANYETFYENEERSRNLAYGFLNKCDVDTWVLVSDVDEAIDATCPQRRIAFLDHLKANERKTIYFGHLRAWYDFNNHCSWKGIFTPATQVGTLWKEWSTLRCRSRRAGQNVEVPAGDNPFFFEYSFCFPKEAMWEKLNSFIHDGYTREELDVALATNSWVKSAKRCESVGSQPFDWFELVELTEKNSPKYVRDNFETLRTNVISKEYRENRRNLYGV